MRRNHIIVLFLFFSTLAFAQDTLFIDNFDSYTSGQTLACQDSVNWTTWSNDPCGNEDALISNAQSTSAPNSVKIMSGDDLVKPLANYTSGSYSVVFEFYVPAGKSGYFNVLNLFLHNTGSVWAFECYLNDDGTGLINAGGNNAATFNYTQGAWHTVEVMANMVDTNDIGTFMLNGVTVHTWEWSSGATGSGNLKQLGGVNFYGAEPTNELYVDDFQLWENMAPVSVDDFNQTPSDFMLAQNYPNPFNPSTIISYSIPEAANVKLVVFNMLGEEIATLINTQQDAGIHQITFNAEELPSGSYFYRLEAGNKIMAKKMLLTK